MCNRALLVNQVHLFGYKVIDTKNLVFEEEVTFSICFKNRPF